jgi:hypothetical protein
VLLEVFSGDGEREVIAGESVRQAAHELENHPD